MSKILVVEDNMEVAATIEKWLTHEKFTVEMAYDGQEAIDRLRLYQYDAIVLDWELPKRSGVEICSEFRRSGGTTPILMLTGKSQLNDKSQGFDAGADDYLTKPFDVRELSMRLRAIMRRGTAVTNNTVEVGPLNLDTKMRKLTINEQSITLLPKEYAILELMMRFPNEIFSAEALLNRVWSSESEATEHSVRTYMHTLRKKLTTHNCDLLKTVHGLGYRLERPAD